MDNLKIVGLLTAGLALASIFGYLAQRFKLPYILGYLLAGYLIGPYSPGFVVDLQTSEELAEVGVILMLFGVGLHFRLNDLIKVKSIAIPGAVGQTLTAALLGTGIVYLLGFPLHAGLIVGLALGVASTVVLVRVLMDNNLLSTPQGHIAVGWLVVEDIFTVAFLLFLPVLADFVEGAKLSFYDISMSILLVFFKFFLLAAIMFTWGHRMAEFILTPIARLRSHELFTLTVLALIFTIAIGSAYIFGTSIALGAFIAGMVIGQTDLRHQVLANSLPLQAVFAVVFFLSVGMLFNPMTVTNHPIFFLSILAIILIAKPLIAWIIVTVMKYNQKTALTVALALAQIGEFSFILAEQGLSLHLLPEVGYDILVACALVSISINPLLFQFFNLGEPKAKPPTYPIKAKFLRESSEKVTQVFETQVGSKVIIVGFGPIGKAASDALEKIHLTPVIIEQNIDAIPKLKNEKRQVIYGDATQPNILESAQINSTHSLIITVPDIETTISIIKSAQHLNPRIRILARVMHIIHVPLLQELNNVDFICCEMEASKAFANAIIPFVVRT